MKKVQIALVAAVAGLLIGVSSADAACKSKYYSASDLDPIWWQGRDYARSNWSDKVKGVLGGSWAKWAKARNKDENCDWLPTRGVNYCVAKAQPCK
jgi:hypothetical protein